MPVVCIEVASRRPQPVKMPPPPLAVGWKCSALQQKKSLESGLHSAFLYRKFSYHAFVYGAFLDRGRVSRVALPFPQPAPRPTPRNKMPPRARVPSLLGPAGDDNAESESEEEQVSPSISPLRIQAQEAELHRTRLPRDLGRRLHRQFPAYIVLHGGRRRKIN